MFYVRPDQYRILRERYLDLFKSDFKGIDRMCVATLKEFKSIPGIAPIWSCSGHKDGDRAYYAFAVANREAEVTLRNIFETLMVYAKRRQKSEAEPVLQCYEFQIGFLEWCFGGVTPEDSWYPVFTIGAWLDEAKFFYFAKDIHDAVIEWA